MLSFFLSFAARSCENAPRGIAICSSSCLCLIWQQNMFSQSGKQESERRRALRKLRISTKISRLRSNLTTEYHNWWTLSSKPPHAERSEYFLGLVASVGIHHPWQAVTKINNNPQNNQKHVKAVMELFFFLFSFPCVSNIFLFECMHSHPNRLHRLQREIACDSPPFHLQSVTNTAAFALSLSDNSDIFFFNQSPFLRRGRPTSDMPEALDFY